MTPDRKLRLSILGGLALLMLATRFHHFLEVPDASWAVFFVGGFCLPSIARWAFPILVAEAVAIDWFATQQMGVSDYCITPAYWFLVPTYAAMGFGGLWLRRRATFDGKGAAALMFSAVVSTTVAYAISNGSFYWLGGRVAERNLAQYLENFVTYYRYFLLVPCAYIAAAAVVHVGVSRALRGSQAEDSRTS